jgi:hypothetical protein
MSNYVKIFMERKMQENSRADWLKYDLQREMSNSVSPFRSKKQNDENKPINFEDQIQTVNRQPGIVMINT